MMIIEWLQAKKQNLEAHLETLEPSERVDVECTSENYFTLSLNIEYIKNMKISKDNDSLLMGWINERKYIEMGVIYKILEACDDVRRCELIGIINPKDEREMRDKLARLSEAKQQISILEKTLFTPLITIQSPATTVKILEDFLKTRAHINLKLDDKSIIREFVLRGYAKYYLQKGKSGKATNNYKLRMDKATLQHIRKSKEFAMRIVHKETYNFVREDDDPQIIYTKPFKLLNDL